MREAHAECVKFTQPKASICPDPAGFQTITQAVQNVLFRRWELGDRVVVAYRECRFSHGAKPALFVQPDPSFWGNHPILPLRPLNESFGAKPALCLT
jgi:hypothetical protein